MSEKQFTVPPHLEQYTAPLAVFRAANPQYTHFVVGGLVFSNPTPTTDNPSPESKVLLLRRALTDSLPGYWEGPGGGCEETDDSIVDAVVREVREESGLHVSRVVDLVGIEEWVKLKPDQVVKAVKFHFLVEVWEAQGFIPGGEGQVVERWEDGVLLTPEEHDAFVWEGVDEVRASLEGKGKYMVLEDEGRNLVKAFELVR
ncbi:NUDIX hydrolase domain-like protein [Aspergillus avenaceus]|uniref:NUDIX hydrolase domain-like protein n=1 Tax=Aspergillus avenaceus TaxID=36643 RepID=A0A5N6U2G7_ASPAV|nr:NUDIX hydrolase domain-like protein [Aspergillus avenaceus]